jgi:hypothetical protein
MCCGAVTEEDIASVAAIRREEVMKKADEEETAAESTWVPGLPLAKEWHDRGIYHDDPDCPEAAKVDPARRRPGSGGFPRCKACGKAAQEEPETKKAKR